MTTITTTRTTQTPKTLSRGWRIYHVWSKVYPSHNRRYEGQLWAGDPAEAGDMARLQFGIRRHYDIQTEKFGGIVVKNA